MSLSITVSNDAAADGDARSVVLVSGEVDVSNADELRAALDDCLEGGATSLVADISEVPYIDSTGIGVLVASPTAPPRRARASRSPAHRETSPACSGSLGSAPTSTSARPSSGRQRTRRRIRRC